jgi:hypothetical protein
MKSRFSVLLLLLLLLAAAATAAVLFSAAEPRRLYEIRLVDEVDGSRRVLYRAEVEGPADSDFRIELRDRNFELDATVLNEPAGPASIDSRLRLQSRRRHGQTRDGVPLWEEHRREHRAVTTAAQQLDILPFGGRGPDGLLKFEVAHLPMAGRRGADPRSLQVRITEPGLSGTVRIAAFRIPHHFEATARLTSAEGEIASGRALFFTGERGVMQLVDAGSGEPMAEMLLTIGPADYADPWTTAAVDFSLRRTAAEGGQWLARDWSGTAGFGQSISYPILARRAGATLTLEITNRSMP